MKIVITKKVSRYKKKTDPNKINDRPKEEDPKKYTILFIQR